jgi:hypothetical protein
MKSNELHRYCILLKGILLVAFCVGIIPPLVLLPTMQTRSQQIGDVQLYNHPLPSPATDPVLSTPLSVFPFEISPANQDAHKDNATFAFTSVGNIDYNFSIEEDIQLVELNSRSVTLAGNSSFLLLLSLLIDKIGINYNTTVYVRNSTDLGRTWSVPQVTNLSHYGSYGYIKPKLLFNATDGTFILMMIMAFSSYLPCFWKSPDGITWTYIDQIINVAGSYDGMNCDATLSYNNTEILVAMSNSLNVYFFKSQGGNFTGVSTISVAGSSSQLFSPAIARSPTNNKTAIFWWNTNARNYYYSESSAFGADGSWSPAVRLDASRGLGDILGPNITYFTSYGFQVGYNATGHLNGYVVVNRTALFSMTSSDDGAHWNNFNNFRAFGSIKYIYDIHYVDIQDGNTTLTFSASFNGNYITNLYAGSASGYFVRPNKVFQLINSSALGGVEQIITWAGRDTLSNFVRDGVYLARLWYKNAGTSQINLNPSEMRVRVDNTLPTVLSFQTNANFSPVASLGVQDFMSLNLRSSENGQYDVYYKNQAGNSWKPEVRFTDSDAQDYQGDVAIDEDNRIWCIYLSFRESDSDLFLQYSDDFGITYSLAQPVVVGPSQDYCPSITIIGSTIYVAFVRVVPDVRNPEPGNVVYDIYFTKSMDGGLTWMIPMNLTASNYNPNVGYGLLYSSPDILVTPNGTILLAYYAYASWDYQFFEIINSTNGGQSFSSPSVVRNNYGLGSMPASPIALFYDTATNNLYAVTGHDTTAWVGYSVVNLFFEISRSSDTGSSWTLVSGNNAIAGYLENIGDALYIRGLTLDRDTSGQFIVQALYKPYQGYPVLSTFMSSTGASWSSLPDKILDSLPNTYTSTPPPMGQLRSGHSSQGDIFYVYDRTPIATLNRDLFIKPFTITAQHAHGTLFQGSNQVVVWDGQDFWGEVQDGNYSANILVTDIAGNVVERAYNCTLDNSIVQLIYNIPNLNDFSPRIAHEITALFSGPLDAIVSLYYSYNPTSGWNILPTSSNTTDVYATIPLHPTAEKVYFYFNATDAAGNTFVTSIKNYYEPVVGFQIRDYATLIAQASWDPFTCVATVTAGNQYISFLYLNYTLDGVETKVVLTNETATRYVHPAIILASFPNSITYRLYVHYTNEKEQLLQSISLIAPQFILNEGDFEISFTSADPQRKLDAPIQFSVNGIDLTHTSKVFLDYKFNEATSFSSLELVLQNGTSFVGELPGSQQTFRLEYRIRLLDQAGVTHILKIVEGNNALIQDYIPAFPDVELSVPVQTIIVILSAALGVAFSLIYYRNKRQSTQRIQERFITALRSESGPEAIVTLQRDIKENNDTEKVKKATSVAPILDRGSSSYKIGVITTLITLGVGLIFTLIPEGGLYAILFTTIAIALSTYAWYELGLNDIARILYSDVNGQYRLAIFTTALNVAALIAFMYAGTFVDWFNYYIIEDTLTWGDLQVPNLWISLVSTFLSSVLILEITNYKDLNNSREDRQLEKTIGTDIRTLWQHREESVAYYNKAWVISTLSFLVYIAMAVISTTDLGRYAALGLMALVPFVLIVIGFFLADIFLSTRRKSVKQVLDSWLIEPTKNCPDCGCQNLFSNRFCTNCQRSFGGTPIVIDDTIECSNCGYRSPKGSIYCRLCGTAISERGDGEAASKSDPLTRLKTTLGKVKDVFHLKNDEKPE